MEKPIGAKPNSRILNEYKDTIKELTPRELEVAVGNVFGDVSIQTQNQGRDFRLKFEWAIKAYAQHIWNELDRFIIKEELHVNERMQKSGNISTTYTFSTFSHPAFNAIADIFLDSNFKKTLPHPEALLNLLTPRAIAYWFMDDGGKYQYGSASVNTGATFNTQGIPEAPLQVVADGLTKKYGFPFNIGYNKKKPVIIVPTQYTVNLVNLIDPYIIPEMRYKMPRYAGKK